MAAGVSHFVIPTGKMLCLCHPDRASVTLSSRPSAASGGILYILGKSMKVLNKISLAVLFFLLGGQLLHAQYDKDVFFARGRQALADGKYALAIENFNILSQLDTTDCWTYFFRGIAKYNLGDIRGANRDFDRSVRVNPVFTSGYHYRGITQSRFGDYEAALNDIQKAIELRPGYTGLYFSRGVTYFLSQQFDKAVDDFDRYIRREKKDPSAYLNRGASYLFLGDTLKALNDYNKAIKLDRFDPEGYVRRGRLYASQNDFDKAVADMNVALQLDTANTFAYFNRAIMYYEQEKYREAMDDLNKVLKYEPGNALTLYNRGLISAQLGDYEAALSDMDRVIDINPNNVLAHFNRASVLIELGMYQSALADYDRAIELYPDFAKAYMNRAYVKNLLGQNKSSKEDYDTARKKVEEYRARNAEDVSSLADTTKKYSNLLALDAEFAKNDFNDELLQHRDIDVRLRPLYKFVLNPRKDNTNYALNRKYEHPLVERFIASLPVGVSLGNEDVTLTPAELEKVETLAWADDKQLFLRALHEYSDKKFNSALTYYSRLCEEGTGSGYEALYRAFSLMNRGVLRAEMIDFISSIENSVQVLTMDDKGSTRARVKDQSTRQYDYGEAVADLKEAAALVPDLPYVHFDLANLLCLSAEHIASIEEYGKAIELYPYFGDAYYNRGLVLIYLQDKEKGCIDLSRAGELGVESAYGAIKKYCDKSLE